MASLAGDVRSRGHNGSRISGPLLPFFTHNGHPPAFLLQQRG